MDAYRKIPKPTNATPTAAGPPADPAAGGGNVSVAPLITMIAVLIIILIFCFCGAPAVRQFCRRRVCCCCPEPESDESTGTPVDNTSTTPTIILLPFGRMLVVDRSVFTQFQTDEAGLDFMELSANLIRAHHLQYPSTPSILDSETTSKGLSPSSLGLSPPAYEDIYGDLPPSYSEVSLLFRRQTIVSRNLVDLLPPGPSADLHIENERVPEGGGSGGGAGRRYLASEEDFDVLDAAAPPRPLTKQSSF